MSHYHIAKCDRCNNAEKSECQAPTPRYWVQVEIKAFDYSSRELQLCRSCYTLLDSFLRSKTMELIDTERYERKEKEQSK